MLIGLTGLYCAGKNHIGLLLEKLGLPVLDADKLGHEVINRETKAIISRFGKGIMGSDGQIDRKLLGKHVFGRPEELTALEKIVHPGVDLLIEQWINTENVRQAGYCVINAALLHKSSVFGNLNAIIVVHAPFPVRFFRALRRDKLPLGNLGELIKRFLSQKDFPRYKNGKYQPQLFSTAADIYTIRNSGFSGSQRALEKRIDIILEGLRHGKEKIIAGCSDGGSIPGDRGERRDPYL